MKSAPTDITKDEVPVQEEEIATHQEAIPVPYLAGTRRVSLRWLTDATDMATKQSKDANYGKK